MNLTHPRLSPLPSMGDFLFLTIMLVLLITIPNYVFSDASTGWHLALGDYVLEHGAVPHQDFISYTFAGKPWIAFYWLADIFISAANKVGQYNGVAVLVATTLATLFLCLYGRCRAAGCSLPVTVSLVFIGIIASTVHWLVRPHLITFIGVYLFATRLEDFYRDRLSFKGLLLIAVPTMLVWVNSHPGFLIGFVQAGIYLAVAIATFMLGQRSAGKSALKLLLLLAIMAAGTMLTPYGTELYANLAGYLKQSTLADLVDEYLSPVFHGSIQSAALELLFFALAAGLAFSKRRPSLPQLISVIAFAYLALNAVRNIPLFVLVAVPFIAELFADISIPGIEACSPRLAKFWQYCCDTSRSIDETESTCKMHLLPILTVAVFSMAALSGGKLFGEQILSCGFNPETVPMAALECLKKLPVKEGFNHVNWGGYINYETKIPVYIDDRSAFYGEEFYLQYAEIISPEPGWEEKLQKQGINWIIFPKNQALSRHLLRNPNWHVICEDKAAYIFQRNKPISK